VWDRIYSHLAGDHTNPIQFAKWQVHFFENTKRFFQNSQLLGALSEQPFTRKTFQDLKAHTDTAMDLPGQRKVWEHRALLHQLITVAVNLRSRCVNQLPSMAVEDIEFLVVDYVTEMGSMGLDTHGLAIALKRFATEFLKAKVDSLVPSHVESFTCFPRFPLEV
jgi:hypothetical protein